MYSAGKVTSEPILTTGELLPIDGLDQESAKHSPWANSRLPPELRVILDLEMVK